MIKANLNKNVTRIFCFFFIQFASVLYIQPYMFARKFEREHMNRTPCMTLFPFCAFLFSIMEGSSNASKRIVGHRYCSRWGSSAYIIASLQSITFNVFFGIETNNKLSILKIIQVTWCDFYWILRWTEIIFPCTFLS